MSERMETWSVGKSNKGTKEMQAAIEGLEKLIEEKMDKLEKTVMDGMNDYIEKMYKNGG